MADSLHIIERCLFRIDIPNRRKADLVYEQVSALGKSRLPLLLEQVLDTLEYPPGQWIQIDRLVLELGDLGEAEFQADLLKGLERELKKELRKAFQTAPAALSRKAYLMDLLTFFFQHGRYPWWANHTQQQTTAPELFVELLSTDAAEARDWIRRSLSSSPARARFFQQMPTDLLQKSALLLHPSNEKRISAWIRDVLMLFRHLSPDAPPPERVEKWLWEAVLTGLTPKTNTGSKTTPGIFISTAIPYLAEKTATTPQLLQDRLQAVLKRIDKQELVYRHWRQTLQTPLAEVSQPAIADEPATTPAPAIFENPETGPAAEAPEVAQPEAVLSDLQTLLYYLEWGRLPQGAAASMPALEHRLLQFLREDPAQAAQVLSALNRQPGFSQRLAQQVSPPVFQELVQLFLPAFREELPKEIVEKLNSPAARPEYPEQEILLHYLEWSRLPPGVSRSSGQLEAILLQFIQRNPEQAAQLLSALNRKINLAARLTQQFSMRVYRPLIGLFFRNQWPELERTLEEWSHTMSALYPTGFSGSFVWESALHKLLNIRAKQADIPALLQYLAQQMAGKLGLLPENLLEQALAYNPAHSPLSPATRKQLRRISGRLSAAEQAALEADVQTWYPAAAEQPPEVVRMQALFDRIFHRLTFGGPAWWDDSPQNLDGLFATLATLPPDLLRAALLRLWPENLRDKWLPVLSEETVGRLLHTFWGDYAEMALLCTEDLETIALEKDLALPSFFFRRMWLEQAVGGAAVDSNVLIKTALRRAAQHSARPESDWATWLKNRAEPALAAGDIRYHRVLGVLREPADQMPAAADFPGYDTDFPGFKNLESLDAPEPDTIIPPYPELLRAELDAVWQFFVRGSVPPEAGLDSPAAFEQNLRLILEKHPDIAQPLLRRALAPPAAAERLLRHFSEHLWLTLGFVLLKPHFGEVLKLRDELFDLWGVSPDPVEQRRLELHFWRHLFAFSAGMPDSSSESRPTDGGSAAGAEAPASPSQDVSPDKAPVDHTKNVVPTSQSASPDSTATPPAAGAKATASPSQDVSPDKAPVDRTKNVVPTSQSVSPDSTATPPAAGAASLLFFAEGLIARIARETQMQEDFLWKQLQDAQVRLEARAGILKTLVSELLQRRQRILAKPAQTPGRTIFTGESGPGEEAISVHNAGLVVLAPFLPRYFDTLGLLENRVFRDAAAAERAVHLLQYLATLQTETPEHLLVFNKLLCGLPLETPVATGIELSETEEEVSASLLEAVLQNWEMMKNSSVHNLRGAFLIRDGRLSEEPDRWMLYVEHKAYDIVLEYLPWTISMIKLPWMDKRIDVTWRKKP